jgi:hypothetical protein
VDAENPYSCRNCLYWSFDLFNGTSIIQCCHTGTDRSKATEEPTKLDVASIVEKDSLMKRESGVSEHSPMRLQMENFIKKQQKEIVAELEKVDGKKFRIDTWNRDAGGGGISCVLQDGNVFEKAGVNISWPQPFI